MLIQPRSGAENMARDAALMDRARATGEAMFTAYSWARPTLSLGRNQLAGGRYNRDAIVAAGVDVVRRPTGGRALLHDHEVTYSVTAPVPESASLRDSYERINRILIDGLRRLGVSVRESHSGLPTPLPGEIPCFAEPAEGELVTDSGKLVGSAQIREDGALLQHGSILIQDDQHLISSFLTSPRADLEPAAAATLNQALGRSPSVEEVAASLFAAVRSLEDADAATVEEGDVSSLSLHHLAQYENELWTWRR